MRELLLFDMPQPQPVELGENTIHAIITIDQDGQVVGDVVPHKGKMVTPTMPNRGPQVIAIAGSDTVQYFNPDEQRHYQSTIALYEELLAQREAPPVQALLAFAMSGAVTSLDFSEVQVPKDKDKKPDINKVRLAFIYAPTGEYLHECPTVVEYWISLRRPQSASSQKTSCSITGTAGTRLSSAPADVKFGAIKGKLFSCNTDDAVSFGSPKYGSTGVTTETYKELVQRLNYLGNSDDHRLRIGNQTLLVWSDGASIQPLLLGLGSPLGVAEDQPKPAKKIRKKAKSESIQITDTSFEGIKQRLLSLWKGTHAIAQLDASAFYLTNITAQKGRIELSPIRRTELVEVVDNIAAYHTKQLRFSRYSRPHWTFLDALYPAVTSKNKPYTDKDRLALFDHAVYGKPIPRTLISKALGRLRVEGVPIASTKHQISLSNRTYTQLSFLSLAIPMVVEVPELPPLQQQAYALGRLYSYACRTADRVSSTSNHGVRKLWGQVNRNPKRALYQLAKRFPVYVKEPKEQAIFNSLYRAVMEAAPDVPTKVDLDYGVAFMWGISAIGPKPPPTADSAQSAETGSNEKPIV